ncbi:SRPBCC family protein [Pseudomonas aeruginosa]
MAKAHASIDLRNDAEQVWRLIGGFDALPDWLPFIPQSVLSEGGRVRTLQSVEGGTIVERLLDFSEAGRSYTYTILQGPAPVRDYRPCASCRSPTARVRGWNGSAPSYPWASATRKLRRCSAPSTKMAWRR